MAVAKVITCFALANVVDFTVTYILLLRLFSLNRSFFFSFLFFFFFLQFDAVAIQLIVLIWMLKFVLRASHFLVIHEIIVVLCCIAFCYIALLWAALSCVEQCSPFSSLITPFRSKDFFNRCRKFLLKLYYEERFRMPKTFILRNLLHQMETARKVGLLGRGTSRDIIRKNQSLQRAYSITV